MSKELSNCCNYVTKKITETGKIELQLLRIDNNESFLCSEHEYVMILKRELLYFRFNTRTNLT